MKSDDYLLGAIAGNIMGQGDYAEAYRSFGRRYPAGHTAAAGVFLLRPLPSSSASLRANQEGNLRPSGSKETGTNSEYDI